MGASSDMNKALRKLDSDLKKARESVADALDHLTYLYHDVAEIEKLIRSIEEFKEVESDGNELRDGS